VAADIGVNVASGYDAADAGSQGKNAQELVALVRHGLTPAAAIRCATVTASDLLGWADRIGSIEAGKFADLIAVEGDPLKEITVLTNVVFVMKGGTVVKNSADPGASGVIRKD
jgi:imidazolonepropionase-like amidohydrolase